MAEHRTDVAVVGGGIVGLGIAWAFARSGRTVTVVDPAPASGATYAAAGMLAATSEFHYGEEDLLEAMVTSALCYPAFIDTLGDADTGYETVATVVVGADGADRRSLAELREVQVSHGLRVSPLSVREARVREPLLSPQLTGAFTIDHDHRVDPRRLARELRRAIVDPARAGSSAAGTEIPHNAVALLHVDPSDPRSRVSGVALADGSTIQADEVIVANGMSSGLLDGLPDRLALPLRPVHGDILRLRVPEHLRPFLTHTIRGLVHGVPVYLVPRTDGTVVIGATQREDAVAGVSAGGVYQLLRDAQVLVPAVAELELIEATARARPATPDNAPLLGRVARSGEPDSPDIPGLIIATGFFRHGVLLTPFTANYCLGLVDGAADERWRHFRPDRFSPLTTGRPSHA